MHRFLRHSLFLSILLPLLVSSTSVEAGSHKVFGLDYHGKFASSIAVLGDTVAVTAPNADTIETENAGKVYFLKDEGGKVLSYEASFTPEWSQEDQDFGHKVVLTKGLEKTWAFVTAPNHFDVMDNNYGRVFVFCKGCVNADEEKWQAAGDLTQPNALISQFGVDIAVQGNKLVVSAVVGNNPKGAVYVYNNINGVWQYDQTIDAEGVGPSATYGASLAITENWIFVGDPNENRVSIYYS